MSKTTLDYTTLNPKYDGFPGLPEKLESEYMQLRKLLTLALTHFRKSGMGDGRVEYDEVGDGAAREGGEARDWSWVMEEDKVKESTSVHSSRFHELLWLHSRNIMVAYAYDAWLPSDILESSTADMPSSAGDSSGKPSRPTRDARSTHKSRKKGSTKGSSTGSGSSKSKVRPHKSMKQHQALVSIGKALAQPLALAKTPQELQRDYYAAESAKLKFKGQQEALFSTKEEALMKAMERIKWCKDAGEEVPGVPPLASELSVLMCHVHLCMLACDNSRHANSH